MATGIKMGIKVLLVHVMLHNEEWVCFCLCVVLGVWVGVEIWIHTCMLVIFFRWTYLHIHLCITMRLCACVRVCAKTQIRSICRSYMHWAALCTTARRHIEIFTPSLRNRVFFLSLQLGETNRPVMQQWEALNAKHIIREERRWRRRKRGSRRRMGRGRRTRRAGDKKKSRIGKRRRKEAIQRIVTHEGPETDRWTYPRNKEREVRWGDLAEDEELWYKEQENEKGKKSYQLLEISRPCGTYVHFFWMRDRDLFPFLEEQRSWPFTSCLDSVLDTLSPAESFVLSHLF